MDSGTLTALRELLFVITNGADTVAFIVNLHTGIVPAFSEFGVQTRDSGLRDCTASESVFVAVSEAVTVTIAGDVAARSVVKEAADVPAGISTLAGTLTSSELLVSVTTFPPSGAGASSVTVQGNCEPATGVEELQKTDDTVTVEAGIRVTKFATDTPL